MAIQELAILLKVGAHLAQQPAQPTPMANQLQTLQQQKAQQ